MASKRINPSTPRQHASIVWDDEDATGDVTLVITPRGQQALHLQLTLSAEKEGSAWTEAMRAKTAACN